MAVTCCTDDNKMMPQ